MRSFSAKVQVKQTVVGFTEVRGSAGGLMSSCKPAERRNKRGVLTEARQFWGGQSSHLGSISALKMSHVSRLHAHNE